MSAAVRRPRGRSATSRNRARSDGTSAPGELYAEMVVRTTTRQAVVQGQVDRMASHGVNLARVSTHSSSCPICIPLEGKLISLDGTVSEYQGEPVADSSSLPPLHPNCRHTIYPVVAAVDATRERMAANA